MQQLQQILSRVLNIDTHFFQPDTQLLGAIPELDSMAIMSLLLELEQDFAIDIDNAEISAEHFATLASLQTFVQQQDAAA